MQLRSYYWNTRKVNRLNYYRYKLTQPNKMVFKYGNSGDIFTKDLLQHIYKTKIKNVVGEGNRLLTVGSIMNVISEGDIICGIGWKGNALAEKNEILANALVYGVRGPLTKELFEKSNADMSHFKFEYDPGLLIKEVYNLDLSESEDKEVLFIPHYRDNWVYKDYPKGVKVVNIDNKPEVIATEIMKAKVVYASSLHGIIFSHALNKPCVFVSPQSEEPIFKYRDYYLSVGLELPRPLVDIFSINYLLDKAYLPNKSVTEDDFHFPDINTLIQKGILK